MDCKPNVAAADKRWHACDPLTGGYDQSQRHWIWAQLGRVPLWDTASIGLNTCLIQEGIYLSAQLGREVTAQEIKEAPADVRLKWKPRGAE